MVSRDANDGTMVEARYGNIITLLRRNNIDRSIGEYNRPSFTSVRTLPILKKMRRDHALDSKVISANMTPS